MSEQKVTNEGFAGKYYHTMLNMSDDDLDVYEYRLLGHYQRVCGSAGHGSCWESTRTTATKTKISIGKVSAVRKSLQDKGYISITTEHDKADTLLIMIIDRWAENIMRYNKENNIERSPHEQGVHHMNIERSPHETKNNHIRKTNEEKESPLNPPDGESEAVKDSDISSTALNDMKQAVKQHLKQYNPRQQENVAKILLGVAKGKNVDFNISKPITPYMLDVFVTWWDDNHKKNGVPLTRPKNMDSVKQWVESWLEDTYKPDNKSSALNGSKPVEGRYIEHSATPVTDLYRKQYGLPDVTESDMPDFLKESL